MVIYRTDSNPAPSPALTYRPIGDDVVEKIGREVSELVIASRPDDCTHLEVRCAICVEMLILCGKKFDGQVQKEANKRRCRKMKVDVNTHAETSTTSPRQGERK